MPRFEKIARAILLGLIFILLVLDAFILVDMILRDPVGHLGIH
jgi:hypothetical protein